MSDRPVKVENIRDDQGRDVMRFTMPLTPDEMRLVEQVGQTTFEAYLSEKMRQAIFAHDPFAKDKP